MDFDDFWCKMKLRVCLFCFRCFQYTFVEPKTTKTFSEVKSSVFSLPIFQSCCVYLVRARYNSPRKIKICNVIIGSSQVEAVVRSLSFILHQQSSKSIYTQKSSRKYDIIPRNNISYQGDPSHGSRPLCHGKQTGEELGEMIISLSAEGSLQPCLR